MDIHGMDISKYRAGEEKFRKAFHSTSVIMLIFSLDDGKILEANEAACAMTGYNLNEMIGKTVEEIYPDRADRKRIKRLLVTEGGVKDTEIKVHNKSGAYRYGLFSMDLLTLEDRPCILTVGSDFTLRKQAEDALKKAYKEQGRQKEIIEKKSVELEKAKRKIEEGARLIEEASQHKTEFIANMSHELRTPLNSIILLSDLLTQNREGRLSKKELEYASVILSAGKDLLSLINDVLDLSKVEAGRMEVNLTHISLEYLCRKIKGYFGEMADVKGLEFSIRAEPGLTEHLMVDSQKLEQILKNLISNALKFTEKGGVDLWIHRPSTDEDLSSIGLEGLDPQKALAFSVKDTGIGIAPEKLDVIFECFIQAEKETAETFGGTGLGLPVSRVLAQLLGGDIRVQSQPMLGSTFTLYIPDHSGEGDDGARIGNAMGDAVHATSKPCTEWVNDGGASLKGKKILIADDDMRTVYSLIQSFENLSAEVIVAWDGVRCVSKLEEKPDMVLLDIAMPEMNGYQVLEVIRNNPESRDLKVVVISANVMGGEESKCLNLGADAFMGKPLDFEKLVSVMVDLFDA